MGGLHAFMDWSGPILTDSGGFQVFSLAARAKITEAGASFRSHLDGSLLELTPERAVSIQENLGADVAMCLDVCPALPADKETMRIGAVDRTVRWARQLQGGTHQGATRPCSGSSRAVLTPTSAKGAPEAAWSTSISTATPSEG